MSRTNLQLAERTVPRYTSYPTAPQFTAAYVEDKFAEPHRLRRRRGRRLRTLENI